MISNQIRQLTFRFISAPSILATIFVVVSTFAALGQVARWTIMEPISLVDNFYDYGNMYPDHTNPVPHGSSTYFPGVIYLGVLLRYMGFDYYLAESMVFIACISLMLFLLAQIKLAQSIDASITFEKFTPFMFSAVMFLAPFYWFYAREFKPDTIGMLVGYAGLFLARPEKDGSRKLLVVFGACICAASIIFKQQQVSFVFGVILFCFFFRTKNTVLFAAVTGLVSTLIFLLFWHNKGLWFSTVTILANHKFVSASSYFELNATTFFYMFLIVPTMYFLLQFVSLRTEAQKPIWGKASICSLAWVWGTVPAAAAAFLSGWKIGGNAGNTQYGIMLLLPIFLPIFNRLRGELFIAAFWLILILPKNHMGNTVEAYRSANQLRSYVISHPISSGALVISGSDVYFAARAHDPMPKIVNYWVTGSMLQHFRKTIYFDAVLRAELFFQETPTQGLINLEPARIIVENWPDNQRLFQNNSDYEVVFKNSLGIIAERK